MPSPFSDVLLSTLKLLFIFNPAQFALLGLTSMNDKSVILFRAYFLDLLDTLIQHNFGKRIVSEYICLIFEDQTLNDDCLELQSVPQWEN